MCVAISGYLDFLRDVSCKFWRPLLKFYNNELCNENISVEQVFQRLNDFKNFI